MNAIGTRPNVVDEVARKARALFPGVIGEVLAAEIRVLNEFSWVGPDSTSARLYREIAAMGEPGVSR